MCTKMANFYFQEQDLGRKKEKERTEGTKLNLPIAPGSTDIEFLKSFSEVERFIDEVAKPDLIILQCGADCIESDL